MMMVVVVVVMVQIVDYFLLATGNSTKLWNRGCRLELVILFLPICLQSPSRAQLIDMNIDFRTQYYHMSVQLYSHLGLIYDILIYVTE